jgi:hypothetical protein
VTEAIFYSDARVNRWEDKGAFGSLMDRVRRGADAGCAGVGRDCARRRVDLTSKMDKDGTLHWDVPGGELDDSAHGLSLTGAMNRPSVPAGAATRWTS